MWLLNTSIGKKVVMSVTGLFLIFFVTFHLSMNVVAVFSATAYNDICALLGANWYAVVLSIVLAAFVILHFVYAFILTYENYKARGAKRYIHKVRPKGVDWAAENMLVLGIIILLFIVLHLVMFWHKMMYAELAGQQLVPLADGAYWVSPHDGASFINYYFQGNWFITLLYLIWFAALWFHLTHGFWSAIQTIGWSDTRWINRWKCISTIVATLLCGTFAVITIIFFIRGVGTLS